MRERRVQLGGLCRSSGSAFLSQGKTTVWAAVTGPTTCKISKQIMNSALLTVNFQPAYPGQDSAGVNSAAHLKDIFAKTVLLNMFPKTEILLTCQLLHDDSSMLATTINAACLALLDAGIPMKLTVAACTAAVTKDGSVIVDPTKEEESEASATVTAVFDSRTKKVMNSLTTGLMSLDAMVACQNALSENVDDLLSVQREAMHDKCAKLVDFE